MIMVRFTDCNAPKGPTFSQITVLPPTVAGGLVDSSSISGGR